MTTLKERIVHRAKARFVAWCEIAGYLICLGVFVFSIYAFLVRRDIVVTLAGPLEPSVEQVTKPGPVLFTDLAVEAGDLVEQGQLLARVAMEDNDRRRARARVSLSAAAEALTLLEADEADDARRLVNDALGILPDFSDTSDIRAPIRGLAYPEVPWIPGLEEAADEILYTVYGLSILSLSATVSENGDPGRLAVGQEAIVTIGDPAVELRGVVASVEPNGAQLDVVLEFEVAEVERVADFYREVFEEEGLGRYPQVTATVIVGSRNLFLELFGRR